MSERPTIEAMTDEEFEAVFGGCPQRIRTLARVVLRAQRSACMAGDVKGCNSCVHQMLWLMREKGHKECAELPDGDELEGA